MTEFNQVFDGDLAERVFIIGSIIFLTLSVGGIFLRRPVEGQSRRMDLPGKAATAALFLAVTIPAMFGVIGLFNSASSKAAFSPASISIDELHRSVDMNLLPVQQADAF